MKKRFLHLSVGMFICISPQFSAIAQETVFANYFDIPADSPAGTEGTGRIHLERNKDVLTRPIPKEYRFKIVKQPENKLFRIDTQIPDSKDAARYNYQSDLYAATPIVTTAQEQTTLNQWFAEDHSGNLHISISGDTLDITTPKGLTLWYKKRLTGEYSLARPVIKEYADKQHLLSPNQWYHVRIQVKKGKTTPIGVFPIWQPSRTAPLSSPSCKIFRPTMFIPLAHAFGCAFDFLTATAVGTHVTLFGKAPSPKI